MRKGGFKKRLNEYCEGHTDHKSIQQNKALNYELEVVNMDFQRSKLYTSDSVSSLNELLCFDT